MSKITVYEKPTCTTCRKVHAALKEAAVDFKAVNYFIRPMSGVKIKELLSKMGISAGELLRKKEPVYKRLGLDKKEHSADELVALMAEYPDLIQRPIIEMGKRAVLARPPDRIFEIVPRRRVK